jgi:molybdopterin-guanine dinucleotide biosynthesis protein A
MGKDKTFLEVGGRPMLAWIMEALTGAGVEPVIAGRPSPFDRISSLPDPPDVAGPAAALTAAFRSLPGAYVVLVGADQPHLRSETVIRLLDIPGAAVTVVDDHRQTLCTVYRDRCAPVLERLITESSDPPLQVLLDRVETVEIAADTYGAWGEDGRSWLSIDDPETLRAVREAWPDRPS